MKQLLTTLVLALITTLMTAQAPPARKSPLVNTNDAIGDVTVSLQYGSPAVRGRSVWGVLVPYDKIWRTGANEASKVSFSKDVMIEGEAMAAGSYALFTIPSEGAWTVIFNSVSDQWGAYDYDEEKDALRVSVTPKYGMDHCERMQIITTDAGLELRWADLVLPISVTTKQ